MGLDAVELLLDVEQTFQIHIDDAETSRILTVGDLHQAILLRVKTTPDQRCLTSMAFYRLRRGIVHAVLTERRAVRPDTSLAQLFPRRGRREQWTSLQRAASVQVPDLQHAASIGSALLLAGIATAVTPAVYAGLSWRWTILLLIPGLLVGALFVRCTKSLAEEFPRHCETAGDLARVVVADNPAALAQETQGWTAENVWETLCSVVVRKTGLPRASVLREARIVDDLGID